MKNGRTKNDSSGNCAAENEKANVSKENVSAFCKNRSGNSCGVSSFIKIFRFFALRCLPALAARLAESDSFVDNSTADGHGSGLSGGEKQRISIARSLLKKSSVLLADEVTAALDAQTAHRVSSDILDLQGITRIVVTHTLEESLLRRYDKIFVLRSGRIEEAGSFADLMANKGYFYALFTVAQ